MATATSTTEPPTAAPTTAVPPATGKISGSVWEDANGNGSKDGAEGGMGSVTVKLGMGSCSSSGFKQTSTSSGGGYSFSNLAAGTYCVSVNITPACGKISSATTSTKYTVTLSNGQTVSKSFGYQKMIC
jgi:hypothetical protein